VSVKDVRRKLLLLIADSAIATTQALHTAMLNAPDVPGEYKNRVRRILGNLRLMRRGLARNEEK